MEKKIYSIELQGVDKIDKDIDNLADSFGHLEDNSRNLKKELKEAILELQNLPEGSKEFDEAAKRAGALKDQIGDINQRVKILASDTSKLDGFIDAAQGITAGFAVAQGAMALFGVENEKLQETLVKIQGAIAILNGLQAIQNVLNKDSAATILFKNAQLGIENALQSKNIIIKGAATVAQRILNATMSANPIGVILIALGALIALYVTFGDKIKELIGLQKSEKELNEELIAQSKAREEQLRKEIELREKVTKSLREFQSTQRDNLILAKEVELFDKLNSDNQIIKLQAGIALLKLQKELNAENVKALEIAKRESTAGNEKAKANQALLQARLEEKKTLKDLSDAEELLAFLTKKRTEVARVQSRGLVEIKTEEVKQRVELEQIAADKTEEIIGINYDKILENINAINMLYQEATNSILQITQLQSDAQVQAFQEQIAQLDSLASDVDARITEIQDQRNATEEALENARGARRQRLLNDLKAQGKAEEDLAKKQKKIAEDKAKVEKKIANERLKQQKLEIQLQATANAVNSAGAIAAIAVNAAKQDATFGFATVAAISAVALSLATNIGVTVAKVRQINSQLDSGFADGGYTGKGGAIDRSGHKVAGTVHENEYVVPTRVLSSPKAKPLIQRLERMRNTFADGGFTGANFESLNDIGGNSDLINAINNKPIYVAVTDINLANQRLDKIANATVI
jgi:hypothetical protein